MAGLITPWNFPLVSSAWKIAPALAAGCTVVFKPSEVTPLPEQALAEIALEIGLPSGVFNLLHGDGRGVGEALTAHPGVDKLSFTGSNAVGEAVMAAAARGTRNVSLELGGKSPILVTTDADPELAAELVLAGFCYNAGQMCSATSRLLVHESLADDLHARLDAAIADLVPGDPLDDATTLGPLVNAAQRQRVEAYLATAEAEGLVPTARSRIALPEHGHFIAPRVFRDVPTTSRLWREEIFGPVLCARTVRDDDEAVTLANDSTFGLAATVVAGDKGRAADIAARLQAGNVWCNAHQVAPPALGWGGMKPAASGESLAERGSRPIWRHATSPCRVPTSRRAAPEPATADQRAAADQQRGEQQRRAGRGQSSTDQHQGRKQRRGIREQTQQAHLATLHADVPSEESAADRPQPQGQDRPEIRPLGPAPRLPGQVQSSASMAAPDSSRPPPWWGCAPATARPPSNRSR